MKKIEAWKTTDGRVFDKEDEATAHQEGIDQNIAMEKLLNNFYYTGMSLSDLAEELYHVRFELMTILGLKGKMP